MIEYYYTGGKKKGPKYILQKGSSESTSNHGHACNLRGFTGSTSKWNDTGWSSHVASRHSSRGTGGRGSRSFDRGVWTSGVPTDDWGGSSLKLRIKISCSILSGSLALANFAVHAAERQNNESQETPFLILVCDNNSPSNPVAKVVRGKTTSNNLANASQRDDAQDGSNPTSKKRRTTSTKYWRVVGYDRSMDRAVRGNTRGSKDRLSI